MPSLWRHSIVYSSLLRTALAGGLLIAAITLITYYLIFRAIEERGLIHLEQYAAERAKREEVRLEQIRENLLLASRSFLQRYKDPLEAADLTRFDEIFMRYPDGAIRNRPEHGDGTKEANGWINKHTVLTPELKRRVLVIYDTAQEFLPAWGDTFKCLYATAPEQINFGFDTTIPNWIYDTPADRDQNLNETEIVASQPNNPERLMRWAGPMIEPTYGDYLVTLCLPIDVDGRHLATWCHDEPFASLIEASARDDIAGLTPMLVREDGRVIAHPHKRAEIIAANGQLFMRDDPVLASLETGLRRHSGKNFAGYDSQAQHYYAASRIEWSGWFFIITQPRRILTEQAVRHAQWVLWSGLAAIVLFLVVLAITLRRSVARPLHDLTRAVDRLSEGTATAAIDIPGDNELSQLARAFNRMSHNIAVRDTALRELNVDLERRIAERTKQLQSSEARMRAMLENAPEAIVVLDADTGLFRTGNENALRFFSIDRETLRTLRPVDLSPPTLPDGRSAAEVANAHIAAAVSGKMVVFEWTHRNRDGNCVPCEVRLSRVPVTDRNLLIGTITDISERKQTEAKLLEALEREREVGEMKSNFVSMVSHEFRTPLGVISSSAEILERYLDRLQPAQRTEHLQSIVRSTRQLNDLIGEVILLGKVESSRLAFTPEPIDVLSLCRRLADEVCSSSGPHCPIEVTAKNDLSGTSADESLMRHIFSNLLSNAVKYSEHGQPVVLTIERVGTDAVFQVRDRGIGIPEGDLHALFNAFHRGGNVGTRPGTGLGLVIVHRCVRIHGGQIEVESKVGVGTCFTVRLPLFASGDAADPSNS